MGDMIFTEIGDLSHFDSSDTSHAYAGISPSTYQSVQLSLFYTYSYMKKHDSYYLRYTL